MANLTFVGTPNVNYAVPGTHTAFGTFRYTNSGDQLYAVPATFGQLVDSTTISSVGSVSSVIAWGGTSSASEIGFCVINGSQTGFSALFTGTTVLLRKEVAGNGSTTITSAVTSGLTTAGDYTCSMTWDTATGAINVLVNGVSKITGTYTDNITGMKIGLQNYNDNGAHAVKSLDTSFGAGYSVDSITSPIALGASGSITTTGLGTLTSLTIGGKAVSSLSAPSGDGTFLIPSWTDAVQGFALGSGQAVIAGDGTNTASSTITISPPSGYSLVTLTSVNGSTGYLGSQVGLGVGWQIIFPTAASLSTTTNYIDVDGGIYTDYVGAQTLYARNNTTGIVTQITLINGTVAPSRLALLWMFGM